jgi:signal transduction histidine kinase
VCGNLQSSGDGEDKENFEILENVRISCEAAVEILNDLLCFDKLESGILDLHKLETPVIPFISDCVHMFSSQAREAGIDISLVTSHADATLLPRNNLNGAKQSAPSSAVMLGGDIETGHVRDDEQLYGTILDSDVIMVDKFKMNQVLRNLISNALKFTPAGGSVTVSASFIPDDRLHDDPVAHRRYTFADRKNYSRSQSICIPFFSKLCFLSPQHWRGKSPATVHPVNREIEMERGRESEREIEIDDDVEAAVNSISVHSGGNYGTSSRESNRFLRAPLGNQESNADNGVEEEKTAWGRTQSKITQKSKSSLVSPASQDFTTGKLRIAVMDTGCGISDKNQVRLFKEIVQFTPEVLQAGGGSGLGLYISSNIIQMHSGTIEVQSEGADRGSTFVIEIEMHRQKSLCRSI